MNDLAKEWNKKRPPTYAGEIYQVSPQTKAPTLDLSKAALPSNCETFTVVTLRGVEYGRGWRRWFEWEVA